MNTAHSTALRHLEYHAWATAKTLDSVTPLSHEELLRDMKTAHSSVWGTLEHIYRADNLWLKRLNGASDAKISDDEAVSDLSDLQTKWQAIQAQLISFAASLGETDLEHVMEYRLLSGDQMRSAVYESLLQVVNHGTYHRGQIAAMLRQLGAVPIPTDFIRFVWAIKDK